MSVFTKPARIKVHGATYTLGTMEQLIAIGAEIRERPSYRLVLGCQSCKAVCTQGSLCGCCEEHRRNRHASTGAHGPILTAEEFLERLERIEQGVEA
jgi:hypothetical protein